MAERHLRLGFGLAVLLFLADQALKSVMIGPLALQAVQQIYLLPILNLTWVENYGVALGMFRAGHDAERWILVGVTSLIAGVVSVWITREKNRMDVMGLGLVLTLASYEATDPSFNADAAGQARNWLGGFGAGLADILMQSLGLGAWVLAFLVLSLGLSRATSGEPSDNRTSLRIYKTIIACTTNDCTN
jgi:hypothetical protein